MSDSKKPQGATVQFTKAAGNPLFERAIAAIGHDAEAMRWLLVAALATVGTKPETLTPDELGVVLPEIDRRLRQLVLSDQADQAMARLYSALMSWSAID